MSEPIRRRIIEILASGEHQSGNISDVIMGEYSVSRSAVSWHLAILRDNGWVNIREEWAARFYSLEDDAIDMLEKDVRRLKKIWKRRIGAHSGNDTPPQNAAPIDGPRPPRLKSGRAKVLRGRGARRDPWAPRP